MSFDQEPAFTSVSASANAVCVGDNFTVDATGVFGGIVWEEDVDCDGGYTAIPPSAGLTSFAQAAATDGSFCYRARINNGVCDDLITDTVQVDVDVPSVAGAPTISTNQMCETDDVTFDLTGNTGSTIRWEVDEDCDGGFAAIPAGDDLTNFTETFAPGTYCFRVSVQNGACPADIANVPGNLVVDPESEAGNVSANAPEICLGDDIILTLGGTNVGDAQWQVDAGCTGAFTDIGPINTNPFTVTPPAADSYCYRAELTSGVCPAEVTADVQVDVFDATVGGTASISATQVCTGSTVDLSIAGQTADQIDWQEDPGCAGTFTSIPAAADQTNFTVTPALGSTCYRAVVQNGVCPPETTNEVQVDVDDITIAGTASAAQNTICVGGTAELSIAGEQADQIQWQEDPGCTGTFNNIAGATADPLTTGPINNQTCFRAEVQNGVCPSVLTNVVTISVNVPPNTGTLSLDTTICAGTNSVPLELNGTAAQVERWEFTETTFTDATSIVAVTNTTYTETVTNISATRFYRVVLRNGACLASSNEIQITVDPQTVAGNLTVSSNPVCSGNHADFITVVGAVGGVVLWERSDDPGFTNPADIDTIAVASTVLNITDNTQDWWYRPVVRSGVCNEERPAPIEVQVVEQPAVDPITGPAIVCDGESATLETASFTGTLQWEQQPNCTGAWSNVPGGTDVLTVNTPALTTQTCFRARVENAPCATIFSNELTIDIETPSDAGTINATATEVCETVGSTDITVSGITGNVVEWITSEDGFVTTNVIANTNTTITLTNLTAATEVAVIVQNGVCPPDTSAPILIDVAPTSEGGIIDPAVAEVCAPTNSTTFNLLNSVGDVVQWETSPNDNFAPPITPIANTTTTLTLDDISVTTYVRVIVQSGPCDPDTSTVAVISAFSPSDAGAAVADQTILCGDSTVLRLSGYNGDINWQIDPGCAGAFADIAPAANADTLATGLVSAQTCYRARVTNGPCADDFSNVVTIDITPSTVAGTAGPDSTVCTGANTVTVNLTGNFGDVLRWERADNPGFTGVITTLSVTSTTLTDNNITQDFYYRAAVQVPGCATEISNVVEVTVDDLSVAGTLAADQTQVCETGNTINFDVTGFAGTIVGWDASTDNFNTRFSLGNAGNTTYTENNLTATDFLRSNRAKRRLPCGNDQCCKRRGGRCDIRRLYRRRAANDLRRRDICRPYIEQQYRPGAAVGGFYG